MIKQKYMRFLVPLYLVSNMVFAEQQVLSQVEVKPAIEQQNLIEPKKQQELPKNEPYKSKDNKEISLIYLKDINIVGNTVFSSADLESIYNKYKDKMISSKDLDDILMSITRKYKENGYFLVTLWPEENKKNKDIININILEGAIKFKVLGEDHNNKLLSRYIKNIEECIPITSDVYQRNIELIEKIPGIDYEYRTTIDKKALKERSPQIVKLFFANSHNNLEGLIYLDNLKQNRNQGPLTIFNKIKLNNLLNYNEVFIFDIETSGSFSKRKDLTLAAVVPVNENGLFLSLSGGARDYKTTEKLNVLNTVTKQNTILTTGIITARNFFDVKITNNPILKFSKKLSTSIGYKVSQLTQKKVINNELIDKYTTPLFYLNADYYFRDKFKGENYLNTTLRMSYKFLGAKKYNLKTNVNDFNIISADYQRRDSYKYNFVSVFQLSGQLTNKTLPAIEKIAYGGGDFGSAYGEAIIAGDSGLNSSMKILKLIHKKNNKQIYLIAPYAYLDAGVVSSKNIAKKSAASSVGAGVEIFMRNGLKFGYSLNKPLHVKNVSDVRKNKINHVVTFMAEYKF